MQNNITAGTLVVCPMSDDEDECSYEIGKLINIIKGRATVNMISSHVTVDASKLEPAITQREKSKPVGKKDNGDEVAVLLRGKDLLEVYEIASDSTKRSIKDLRCRYLSLTPSHQRMILGNLIRGSRQK